MAVSLPSAGTLCRAVCGRGFAPALLAFALAASPVPADAAAATGAPTQTTLVTTPNPSSAGQTVLLRATVTPAAATGTVLFLSSGGVIGSADLADGVAVTDRPFAPDTVLSLTAQYLGDAAYEPSESPAVTHVVNKGRVRVTLRTNNEQPYQSLPLVFRATVSPVFSGAGTPSGSVRFLVDGALLAEAVLLRLGFADSPARRDLPPGKHVFRAAYSGDADYQADTSAALTLSIRSMTPRITRVRDVPGDQGGAVAVDWDVTSNVPGLPYVTAFELWRRPGEADPPGAYERVATVAQNGTDHYSIVAATPADSVADSLPYVTFFVTALTADPLIFFRSEPDSGYSVDNVGPPALAEVTAEYGPDATTLRWRRSSAADLSEYQLHAGASAGFTPGAANRIAVTTDTSLEIAADPARRFLKLAAFDVHGNAGRYLGVDPDHPVARLAWLAGLEARTDRILLRWQLSSGSGAGVKLYRRALPGDWLTLVQRSSDEDGAIRYEDLDVREGVFYQYRIGVLEAGLEIQVGETRATTLLPVFALRRAWPNPARGGLLSVDLSLPDDEPAALELLDLAGRRVLREEVGSLGLGRHTHAMDARALAPGLYVLRLERGRDRSARRVVLLP